MFIRRPIVIANWKMNTSVEEGERLFERIQRDLVEIKNKVDVVICPPATHLDKFNPKSRFAPTGQEVQNEKFKVGLGCQNIHWEEKGAYTGEISILMVKDCCQYVIVGHSERREYFRETDEIVNKKIKQVLKHKLIPILCIGEKLEQRKQNETKKIVESQLKEGLNNIQYSISNLPTGRQVFNLPIIAYEPVWAIGTGQTLDPLETNKTCKFIREVLTELYNEDVAHRIRILYGGSVNSENVAEFTSQGEIDGLLVGGASLDAEEFTRIVKSVIKSY